MIHMMNRVGNYFVNNEGYTLEVYLILRDRASLIK